MPYWSHPSMKKGIHISYPGCTGMHYVTHRSHRMQKHKLRVTCPDVVFVESVSVPTEHDN
jgi:hypothetical protein